MVMNFKVPSGFMFKPEDHEMIMYLECYVKGEALPCNSVIFEADFYGKKEPWEIFQEFGVKKSGYFFTRLKKKKDFGTQIVRRIGDNGNSWKGDNKGKDIYGCDFNQGKMVGQKKTYSYSNKMQGNKDKFRWLMTEYTLADPNLKHFDYAVCLIRKKTSKDDDSDDDDDDDDIIDMGENENDYFKDVVVGGLVTISGLSPTCYDTNTIFENLVVGEPVTFSCGICRNQIMKPSKELSMHQNSLREIDNVVNIKTDDNAIEVPPTAGKFLNMPYSFDFNKDNGINVTHETLKLIEAGSCLWDYLIGDGETMIVKDDQMSIDMVNLETISQELVRIREIQEKKDEVENTEPVVTEIREKQEVEDTEMGDDAACNTFADQYMVKEHLCDVDDQTRWKQLHDDEMDILLPNAFAINNAWATYYR